MLYCANTASVETGTPNEILLGQVSREGWERRCFLQQWCGFPTANCKVGQCDIIIASNINRWSYKFMAFLSNSGTTAVSQAPNVMDPWSRLEASTFPLYWLEQHGDVSCHLQVCLLVNNTGVCRNEAAQCATDMCLGARWGFFIRYPVCSSLLSDSAGTDGYGVSPYV